MKIKVALNLAQIVLIPICIAIAPGPVSRWWMVGGAMLFMLKLYLFENPLEEKKDK